MEELIERALEEDPTDIKQFRNSIHFLSINPALRNALER